MRTFKHDEFTLIIQQLTQALFSSRPFVQLVASTKPMRLLPVLTITGLAIILVSANAYARNDAFDGKGNLFVGDAYSGTIFKYTPDGKKIMFASGLMPDGGYDVAFDGTDNLFVSDEENELILKFTPQGKKTTFATGVRARAVIFDNAGNLFVPDYNKQSIFKFTPAGKKSTFASDLSPGAMAFDSTGNLFVSDSRSNSILKFTPDGKKSIFASGVAPLELVFDVSGNLFASDYYGHAILKFSSDGTRTTFVSLSSDGLYDLAVDAANHLFVVDRGSKAIFKLAPDGTKNTFATGDFAGAIFDKAGNLYVWESGSILKFTPDGTRSTFAASDRISPDKKWEYQPDESQPKITSAGTNEVALDLSDQTGGNGFGSATVTWAPDSKRFAFNYGQGRSHSTSLYQLRGDEWKALKSPDDEVSDITDKLIAAQLKRKGLSKKKLSKEKKYLRLISWTPKVINWVDSNTAILYASLQQVTALRDEPGEMFDGFGADLLLTLKFDDAGNWKIIKTHQMSDKEVEQHQ
jgi:sugar lactone lactonase YvrE